MTLRLRRSLSGDRVSREWPATAPTGPGGRGIFPELPLVADPAKTIRRRTRAAAFSSETVRLRGFMSYRVLINDTVKRYLLESPSDRRRRLRKSFEFLETGLWDGGLRVKKLRGMARKTVLEGRVNRAERLLFTLGESEAGHSPERLIYVWGVVDHDQVDRKARHILPDNAPFLHFEARAEEERSDVELDELDRRHFTQPDIHVPRSQDSGHQRWFILDPAQWRRLLLYERGDFEISLFLTEEQAALLQGNLPLLVSGTAGSGKSTLAVYSLLRPEHHGKSKLFLTFNSALRNFSERLYKGLTALTESDDAKAPDFFTFEELCRRITPNASRRFPPGREMDVSGFEQIHRKYSGSEKYDYALAWEEIRSIIKGGKPQLNTARIELLTMQLEKGTADAATMRELREELLGVFNLSLKEPVEKVLERLLGQDLRKMVIALEDLWRNRNLELIRAMRAVLKILAKRDANFDAPLMTLAEYEALGRKRAPNFLHDRRKIHSLALRYQDELRKTGHWDQIDLTRAALRTLERNPQAKPEYDFVACDEVQDFSDLQLSLIFRLPRDPRSLLLAGDPKQIINPSGFRWEEVRQLFYDRRLPVPEIHHLTLNFRCVGSIVRVANQLIRLKQRLLGTRSEERLDEWRFQGRPPCLVESVPVRTMLEKVRTAGADRIILTRGEQERDALKKELETELVMTIREAKGLEFRTVLLWKFAADKKSDQLWSRIVDQDVGRIHDALIRHEINLLYVGVTRARQNLVLYDGPRPSELWKAHDFRDLLFRTRETEYLDQAWQTLSSPEEWREQGDYYQEHNHFRAAGECYRNANETVLMHRALALDAERRGKYGDAARHWVQTESWEAAASAFEKHRDFESAMKIWVRLDRPAEVARCRLASWERDDRFEDLAQHWENQGDLEEAAGWWRRARRADRLALVLLEMGKEAEAAAAFREAQDYQRAAALFLKTRKPSAAAECFEAGGQWEDALPLRRRLKQPNKVLRCLTEIGDLPRLAAFHEGRKEWKEALQTYQRCWNRRLRRRFEEELESPRLLHGKRAIRCHMLRRFQEAGGSWEKVKEYSLGAVCFQKAHKPSAAARCFEKDRQWINAVRAHVRCPDRRLRLTGVRRTLKKARKNLTPAQRDQMEEIANQTAREGRPETGSAIMEELGYRIEAAMMAAAAGDHVRARRLWRRHHDYETARRYFVAFQWHREGAEFFRRSMRASYAFDFDMTQKVVNYEQLLLSWHACDPTQGEMALLGEHVDEFARRFDPEVIQPLLKSLERFDLLLEAHRESLKIRRVQKRRSAERGEEFEKGEEFGFAGLCFLLAGRRDAARRCWERVPPNDHNLTCRSEAGLWRQSIEYLKGEGRILEAARTAFEYGERDLTVELARQCDNPGKAADFLKKRRFDEEALELYLKAKDLRNSALMMQRLRRYEEAAELWKKLGKQAQYRKCRDLAFGQRRKKGQKNLEFEA